MSSTTVVERVGLKRFIVHDGCTYVDTLKTCAQMAELEHKHYLKHDVKVMSAGGRPEGMYQIHLRNNARRRMEAWYKRMNDE